MIQKYKDSLPDVHESCYLAPGSMVIGKVRIGKNSSVWHNAIIRGDVAGITIGENTNIQDGSVIHCRHNMDTSIGSNVTVGHGAILHSCVIGDNCLVGMGAIVLDGAVIGRGSLIAAGAVVTPNTEIPEGSLVLGSPAKVKRQLSRDEIEGIEKNAREYVMLANDYKSDK